MTLEESQRVLDRIKDEDLNLKQRTSDVYSSITDDTDVLLLAKPIPALRGMKLKRESNYHNGFENSNGGLTPRIQKTLAKLQKMKNPGNKDEFILPKGLSQSGEQPSKCGGPSWAQDLAKSELSYLSNGNLKENRRLYSSQPKISFSNNVDEPDLSNMSKALSLNDLNHKDLQNSYSSSQKRSSSCSSRHMLQEKVMSVEKRNRILRQLLYSHNIMGQGIVLKSVGSESSRALSTPEIVPAGRSVHFNIETADILTSTFQNTPKKLTVDVSSIESANSIEPQESSYVQKRAKPKKGSNRTLNGLSLTDETAKRLVSDIPNEKHKQYLNSLIKDIEDSSSSVVTTPWLEVLQRDLGMKTGEVPSVKSKEEREALTAEVEEIIRSNTQPSKTGKTPNFTTN